MAADAYVQRVLRHTRAFSVDAGGTATVLIAGGSGNIWLNAFKLTELAK